RRERSPGPDRGGGRAAGRAARRGARRPGPPSPERARREGRGPGRRDQLPRRRGGRAMRKERTMGPLDGIRVVEIANLISGPFAGATLSDLGADVVKVELPGAGDAFRRWDGVEATVSSSFAAF